MAKRSYRRQQFLKKNRKKDKTKHLQTSGVVRRNTETTKAKISGVSDHTLAIALDLNEKELNKKDNLPLKLDIIATFRPNVLIALTPRMLDASSGRHQSEALLSSSG
jgi:hypothetical protein